MCFHILADLTAVKLKCLGKKQNDQIRSPENKGFPKNGQN